MSEDSLAINHGIIEQVGDIVAAYVSNNHVAAADLPTLIATVHAAIDGLNRPSKGAEVGDATEAKATPAQIRRSVQPDGLISFIDGKAYKTLKRHLTSHGLTPQRYCEQFGLPSDYPMVAPSYSEKRSNLAKAAGLGQFREPKVRRNAA
ncbi:MucR family transcriptional regulator [Methylobacterium sp. J-067]|uniref:MucR family transcriptional regulator n=1 Tax=Methylobacterium sp. J-067 TaxID=2836648 RepID=UPI001FB9ED2C|nr:MucR family transcriptional regulator [Methylobacterium sp. J-067]MCJ2023018.1 MucR family transcriptional regulator [Methylobacterium sp. J-067]